MAVTDTVGVADKGYMHLPQNKAFFLLTVEAPVVGTERRGSELGA